MLADGDTYSSDMSLCILYWSHRTIIETGQNAIQTVYELYVRAKHVRVAVMHYNNKSINII